MTLPWGLLGIAALGSWDLCLEKRTMITLRIGLDDRRVHGGEHPWRVMVST